MDRNTSSFASSSNGSGTQPNGRTTEAGHIGTSSSASSLLNATPRSYVPASLGIASPNAPTKSLSERLKLSKFVSASSSPSKAKSSDGLQFSNANGSGRDRNEFGSFPSIPSWGSQSQHALSNPPDRITASSSTGSIGSNSSSGSSRNFLIPIGATGARQKLSIANASQRRRFAVSEDDQRSAEHHSVHDASHPNRDGSGPNRSRSDHPHSAAANGPGQILQRSSSYGILASKPASKGSVPLQPRSDATASSAELMRQAAMQRLSSQRILPTSKTRSASDNALNARARSGSPSRDTHTAADGVSSSPVSTATARPSTITVPGRTASSLRPSSRTALPTPIKLDEEHGRSELQHLVGNADREDDRSISAPPLTLAESYKRSMLERDTEKRIPSASSQSSAPRTAPISEQKAAPILDLDLPTSSFFFDDSQPSGSPAKQTQPAFTDAQREEDTPESKTQDVYSRAGDRTTTTTAVTRAHGISVPLPASRAPRQAGAVPSSLQNPFDDGVDVEESNRGGQLARSYLALGDDEDESADGPTKLATAQTAFDPATAHVQSQRTIPSASTGTSTSQSTASVSQALQTRFPDKTTLHGNDLRKEKSEPEPQPTSSSDNGVQSPSRAMPLTDSSESARPVLPRDSSLKTLRSLPHKLERQPDPEEEAALIAGAAAATTTSPRNASLEAHTTKQTSTYSPAISGERTSQPHDEGQDGVRWGRSQDVLAAFSPAQQSRFSEASTDLSDSRAPTRNENHFSGRASSISSGDGLEEESVDGHMLPTSAWQEVENALRRFRDRAVSAPADRGNLLRAVLLPFLALEAETATVDVIGSGIYVKGKARRALFFDWINSLLLELQHVQTSADRGAILESIACIIESRNFSAAILSPDPDDEARFSSVFGHILSYAIGELNKKGVYQNTLIFSGRLLAVAFFRVEGVASKLLRALPVNRFALERVAREFDWQTKRPTDFARFVNRFPPTLRQLCYKDSRDYLRMLDSEAVTGAGSGSDSAAEDDRFLVCQPEVEVEMSGNWLRRWQSDDSELFFSFCRSYHRQLASLFASSKSLESASKYFFGGPGYAHLATCVHQKCLALVHRVILSVTTLSSQKNFNPAGETANVLSGSTAGKPRILEAANRRCTAIVVDIVRAPAGANMIFAPMLALHVKALIKRTSLYDVQGVFCLLDWLDGVISHMDSNDLINEGMVDISFIVTTIGMLLEHADHALALMRTIAFCYANFGVLTATTENRVYFCEQILLKPSVFHKLFLSWSFTIRAYYLHLLVFRLARIRDFPSPKDDPTGRTAIRVVRLFNQRLEALRRRHDSLSPEIDSSSDDNKSEDSKSRQSGTSTFVSTIKRTSTDGTAASSEASVEARPKAEKIKAMTVVNSTCSPSTKTETKKSGQSKTKSWLKAFRGNSSKDLKHDASRAGLPSTAGRVAAAESDDDGKTIGSSRTTPRTSLESTSSELSDASTLAGSVVGGRSSKAGGKYEFDIKQQQTPQQQHSVSQTVATPVAGGGINAGSLSPTHDAGIAKDTVFDLQSTHTHRPPTPGKAPQSPRVSKAFSRRASMLPGPASELASRVLEGEDGEVPPMPDLTADQFGLGLSGMSADTTEVYDETLHIYAVQSLREYEQTVQEHDEFFASLPEDQSTQVPRLPVNWPAMWSSTGE